MLDIRCCFLTKGVYLNLFSRSLIKFEATDMVCGKRHGTK